MVKITKTHKGKHHYFQIGEMVYFIHKMTLSNETFFQVRTGIITHVTIGDMGSKPLYHIVGQGWAFDKPADVLFRDYETAFIVAVAERDKN